MAKIKEIERASRPNTMRFILDRSLTQGKRFVYKEPAETVENEAAVSLLSIHHVHRVEFIDHSVLVSQDGVVEWSVLLAQIAPFVREAGPIVVDIGAPEDALTRQETAVAGINCRDIAEQLHSVIDPELGVNIVDLGLVYNIKKEERKVTVEFTATTPGCPMRRYLQQHIEEVLQSIDGIKDYEAKLVWEPNWSVDMVDPKVELFASRPSRQWTL